MKKILLKLAVPAVIIALTFFADCSNPASGDTTLLILPIPPGGNGGLPGGSGGSSGVAVTGVSFDFDGGTLTLGVAGGKVTLTATVTPEDATNKTVSWESNPEEIATVDDYGVVTAEAVGTATITVTTEDGGYAATCTVIVMNSGIGLNPPGTYTFPAAIEGYGAQTPVPVTVINTGNDAAENLTVTLSGADSNSFTLSTTSISDIDIGEDDTFTVVPNTGLAVGTYTARVTVSGGNDISAHFDVSFTVNLVYTISGTITRNIPAGAAAGASVQLKKDGSNTGSPVNTEANGSYTISGVEAGNYTIEVTLAGYTPGTIPAFSVTGDVTGKDLELRKIYGPVVFVKPLAAGDGSGSSWADASNDIQAMIDISDDYPVIKEIWAAAGTYTPAHVPPTEDATTNRDRTFVLKAGIKLYGGFAGNETLLSQRNWTSNPTILSGDFNNNDGGNAMGGFTGMSENAYHVVLGVNIPDDGKTVLDGFTIRGGNGDDTTYSTITVGGKNIERRFGGGMANDSSSPVLTNVTISGNRADAGGGMFNDNSSSPVLTGVTISGNQSPGEGGGMGNYNSSSPVLTGVTISGNLAGHGGGMFNNFSSSPVLTNVIISGNQTDTFGSAGGMYNSDYSSPVLTNVTISGNQTGGNGGGMINQSSSSPVLTNVTISGNQTIYSGSGFGGGGMYNYSSSPQIRNSIIWGNGTSNVTNYSSTPSYTYSLVEGENPSGAGNLNGGNDPKFVNPKAYTSAPSTDGNYRLQATSPAIDAGSNSFYNSGLIPNLSAIITDCGGNGRFNGAVDMGAYESQ